MTDSKQPTDLARFLQFVQTCPLPDCVTISRALEKRFQIPRYVEVDLKDCDLSESLNRMSKAVRDLVELSELPPPKNPFPEKWSRVFDDPKGRVSPAQTEAADWNSAPSDAALKAWNEALGRRATEQARFNLAVKDGLLKPIMTVATKEKPIHVLFHSGQYVRLAFDKMELIPFGTGQKLISCFEYKYPYDPSEHEACAY